MRTWMVLALCAVAAVAHAEPQVWQGRLFAFGRSNGVRLRLDVTNYTATGTYYCLSGSLPCAGRRGSVTLRLSITNELHGTVTTNRGAVCTFDGNADLVSTPAHAAGQYECDSRRHRLLSYGPFRMHRVR